MVRFVVFVLTDFVQIAAVYHLAANCAVHEVDLVRFGCFFICCVAHNILEDNLSPMPKAYHTMPSPKKNARRRSENRMGRFKKELVGLLNSGGLTVSLGPQQKAKNVAANVSRLVRSHQVMGIRLECVHY